MSFAGLIVIGLVALLLLGGLLAALLLLAHPKSRPVGLALLGIGVAVVVGVGSLALGLFSSHREHAPVKVAHHAAPHSKQPLRGEAAGPVPERDRAAAPGVAEKTPTGSAPAPPSTSSRRPGRVLRALGAALARGIEEAKEEQKKPAQAPGAGDAAGVVSATSESAGPPPDWIDTEPGLVGDTYQVSLQIGPFQTLPECEAKLPEALDQALHDYVRQYLGPAAAAKVRFPSETLEKELVKERWEETRLFETVGPMKQLHLLLEFDPKMQQEIARRWDQARLNSRLWYTGTGLAAVLALLAVVYVGLVVDRSTEGRRRGRLGFAAVAAGTLIVVAAAAVIAAVG